MINKELNLNQYWVVISPLLSIDFLTYKFHNRIRFSSFAVFLLPKNKQLKTILLLLIISSIKQKLTLQPIETNKSACNEWTVLSCDLDI